MPQGAKVLATTLLEEEKADEKLSKIAKSGGQPPREIARGRRRKPTRSAVVGKVIKKGRQEDYRVRLTRFAQRGRHLPNSRRPRQPRVLLVGRGASTDTTAMPFGPSVPLRQSFLRASSVLTGRPIAPAK